MLVSARIGQGLAAIDRLNAIIFLGTMRIELERQLLRAAREKVMTPAEISKLTEQAKRAKALMAKSSDSGMRATVVLDRYERTLQRFDAHVADLSKRDAELTSTLAAFGNAGPELDDAFRDDKVTNGSAGSTVVSAKPTETAHLPESKPGT